MTETRAFSKLNNAQISYLVGQKGQRPLFTRKAEKKTGKVCQDLIKSCWDKDTLNRPSFEQILEQLKSIISETKKKQ